MLHVYLPLKYESKYELHYLFLVLYVHPWKNDFYEATLEILDFPFVDTPTADIFESTEKLRSATLKYFIQIESPHRVERSKSKYALQIRMSNTGFSVLIQKNPVADYHFNFFSITVQTSTKTIHRIIIGCTTLQMYLPVLSGKLSMGSLTKVISLRNLSTFFGEKTGAEWSAGQPGKCPVIWIKCYLAITN